MRDVIPSSHETDRRKAQAFLEDFCGITSVSTSGFTSNVRVVGDGKDMPEEVLVAENRLCDIHVWEVGSSCIRIVKHIHIPRLEFLTKAIEKGSHRVRNGSEVQGER
tara:strand:- start:268 stop:588 length:321 start_codon:yes stop_codon:yes gene_type:complete